MVERGARLACATGGQEARIPVLADVVCGLPGGRLIGMHPAKRAVMRRILRRKAAAAGMRLTGASLLSVVDRGEGHVRRALGALNRIRIANSSGRSW